MASATCSYVYCNKKHTGYECSSQYEPVCGFKATGEPTTYDNSCMACRDFAVRAYSPKSCTDNLKYCKYQRADCTDLKNYNPSCAFEPGMPPKSIDTNLCCLGTTYTSVKGGFCPLFRRPNSDLATKCPDNRPKVCSNQISPVCAIAELGHRSDHSNWCQACMNSSVWGYIAGHCPQHLTKPYTGFVFPKSDGLPFQGIDFNTYSPPGERVRRH